MQKMIHVLKRSSLGRWLVIALCASMLVTTTPRKVHAQGLTEYAIILALIGALQGLAADELPPATQGPAGVLVNHMLESFDSVVLAHSQGDVPGQISGLSAAIGDARALEGLTSSCNDCSALTSDLEKLIEAATALRSTLLGR